MDPQKIQIWEDTVDGSEIAQPPNLDVFEKKTL